MKRKTLTPEQIQREVTGFAKALVGTTERHLRGEMCESTWKSHMRTLWAQIENAPHAVQTQVRDLVAAVGSPAVWKGCSNPPTRSKRHYSEGR